MVVIMKKFILIICILIGIKTDLKSAQFLRSFSQKVAPILTWARYTFPLTHADRVKKLSSTLKEKSEICIQEYAKYHTSSPCPLGLPSYLLSQQCELIQEREKIKKELHRIESFPNCAGDMHTYEQHYLKTTYSKLAHRYGADVTHMLIEKHVGNNQGYEFTHNKLSAQLLASKYKTIAEIYKKMGKTCSTLAQNNSLSSCPVLPTHNFISEISDSIKPILPHSSYNATKQMVHTCIILDNIALNLLPHDPNNRLSICISLLRLLPEH